MFVYWANEAKNPFFEANNFRLWVRSHLDLIYQNEKYMIRRIPIAVNEFRYKIFNENYNLLYEEFDQNDKTKKYRGDEDDYHKEECNYKKKLHSNEAIQKLKPE